MRIRKDRIWVIFLVATIIALCVDLYGMIFAHLRVICGFRVRMYFEKEEQATSFLLMACGFTWWR